MKKLLMLAMVLGLLMSGVSYAECPKVHDQGKLIQDIRMCVQEARMVDPVFTAYFDPNDCQISEYGSPPDPHGYATFYKGMKYFKGCMVQAGWGTAFTFPVSVP